MDNIVMFVISGMFLLWGFYYCWSKLKRDVELDEQMKKDSEFWP